MFTSNKAFIARLSVILLSCMVLACGEKKEIIILETPYGDMTAILYDETPIHKENFLKIARSGQFDSVLFHRVIENFMIQTGDLSTGIAGEAVDYTLAREFMTDQYFHVKGALAAARRGDETNPEKRSSGSQFYIVQGETYDEEGLKARAERRQYLKLYGLFQRIIKTDRAPELIEKWAYHTNKYQEDTTYDFGQAQFNLMFASQPVLEKFFGPLDDPWYSEDQIATYASVGGTPHLDGEYTVFGRVVEGLEVIDKIAAVATDKRDKPLKDIRLKVRIESMAVSEYESRYAAYIKP